MSGRLFYQNVACLTVRRKPQSGRIAVPSSRRVGVRQEYGTRAHPAQRRILNRIRRHLSLGHGPSALSRIVRGWFCCFDRAGWVLRVCYRSQTTNTLRLGASKHFEFSCLFKTCEHLINTLRVSTTHKRRELVVDLSFVSLKSGVPAKGCLW